MDIGIGIQALVLLIGFFGAVVGAAATLAGQIWLQKRADKRNQRQIARLVRGEIHFVLDNAKFDHSQQVWAEALNCMATGKPFDFEVPVDLSGVTSDLMFEDYRERVGVLKADDAKDILNFFYQLKRMEIASSIAGENLIEDRRGQDRLLRDLIERWERLHKLGTVLVRRLKANY